ncbi:Hypothetical_protein [Hexamita inflata]|uniref:Hypothetical_protein n=1 Tax=Hexamita inflata TaxID=28002 RepID=A0AA86THX5_9EUKA|nr:Hypothetical protein HINF_LOCUS6779 [Hexamita inflata]
MDDKEICQFINTKIKLNEKTLFWKQVVELSDGKTSKQIQDYYHHTYQNVMFDKQLSISDKQTLRQLSAFWKDEKPTYVSGKFLEMSPGNAYFKHNITMYVSTTQQYIIFCYIYEIFCVKLFKYYASVPSMQNSLYTVFQFSVFSINHIYFILIIFQLSIQSPLNIYTNILLHIQYSFYIIPDLIFQQVYLTILILHLELIIMIFLSILLYPIICNFLSKYIFYEQHKAAKKRHENHPLQHK